VLHNTVLSECVGFNVHSTHSRSF